VARADRLAPLGDAACVGKNPTGGTDRVHPAAGSTHFRKRVTATPIKPCGVVTASRRQFWKHAPGRCLNPPPGTAALQVAAQVY
jgi:hypothetical protein